MRPGSIANTYTYDSFGKLTAASNAMSLKTGFVLLRFLLILRRPVFRFDGPTSP